MDILNSVEKFYTDKLIKFGVNSKGVGWNTKDCHQLRFEKLMQFIPKGNKKITINDLGCGYGAFFSFLSNYGFTIEKFCGYDISQSMIETAEIEIGSDPRVQLIHSATLTNNADYSFASGIFNVKCDADQTLWLDFILTTLDDMYKNSIKGFAFNLLTKYVDFTRGDLYYADPSYFFDLCKTKYSKKVNLVHDYDLWEWTITVLK